MRKLSLLTGSLLGLYSVGGLAQQLPDAGTQLRQIPPVPAPERPVPELRFQSPDAPVISGLDGTQKIRVDSIHLQGQTAFTEADLLQASGFVAGRELNLGELRAVAARIADVLHARGFFVAQAFLPAQDVANGRVTINIVEGHYDKIEQRNSSRLRSGVADALMGEVAPGQTVRSAPLETSLLLLSDLPGVVVRSTLAPGVTVGTSDLFVDVTPGPGFSGSIDADNQGNRYTGRARVGAVLNANELAGLGDVASLRLLTAGDGLKYARGSYQIQVGRGKVGVAYADLDYKLGKEFAALQASGSAHIASVFGSYPLQRTRQADAFLQLSFDDKHFDDRIRSTDSRTDKRSQLLTVNLNGDRRDVFGGESLSNYQLSVVGGDFDPRDATLRTLDASTARARGHFAKINFNLAHLQSLSSDTVLAVSVGGQLASKNLDASEKMALGGAAAVRAYPEGETQADQAYVLSVEARQGLNRFSQGLPGQLQAVAFIDTGTAQINKSPWTDADNHRTLSGGGVGLNWSLGGSFVVKAAYAHTIGGARATSAPPASSRFWLQGVKYF